MDAKPSAPLPDASTEGDEFDARARLVEIQLLNAFRLEMRAANTTENVMKMRAAVSGSDGTH